MKRTKPKYRFTTLLLLTVIISHIFVFHFALDDKVLCIGDGEHFHIENIMDSHFANKLNIESLNKKVTFNNNYNCTDYPLDNHIDEDYAKNRRIIIYKYVQTVNLKNQEINKSNISKSIYSNRYINQKYITEQLPTTVLLI